MRAGTQMTYLPNIFKLPFKWSVWLILLYIMHWILNQYTNFDAIVNRFELKNV